MNSIAKAITLVGIASIGAFLITNTAKDIQMVGAMWTVLSMWSFCVIKMDRSKE